MKRSCLLAGVVGVLLLGWLVKVDAGWMKAYGGSLWDYGWWVEKTSDNGYIVSGSRHDRENPPLFYVYLIKTDSDGETLWTRSYSESEQQSIGNTGQCVQQTADGGYVIVGYASMHLWHLKTDSDGDTLWTRLYETERSSAGYCVRQTDDGGYIISGEIGIPSEGRPSDALWLLRTDSLGDSLWTRTYAEEGENTHTNGWSLQQTPDDGFIITGSGPGTNLWLVKTDSDGDTLWTRTYGREGEGYSVGYCVEPTFDGGWIISGATNYNYISMGALWLLKTDSLGDTLWTRSYDYDMFADAGWSVKQTPDSGYVVAGMKGFSMMGTGALWLLKTDPWGDTLWTRTYGGISQDRGNCVQLTPDGGYIITGFTESFSTYGGGDVWLIKADSLGYVPIEEPVTHLSNSPDLEIASAVGPEIVLRYTDSPGGFHAWVYDSIGRKVDEIHNPASSGTVSWGEGHGPGVYFIRELSSGTSHKLILVR